MVHDEPSLSSQSGQTDCVFKFYIFSNRKHIESYTYPNIIFCTKKYSLLVFPPFSRYLLTFTINPAFSKSEMTRLTALLDSFVCEQIVNRRKAEVLVIATLKQIQINPAGLRQNICSIQLIYLS